MKLSTVELVAPGYLMELLTKFVASLGAQTFKQVMCMTSTGNLVPERERMTGVESHRWSLQCGMNRTAPMVGFYGESFLQGSLRQVIAGSDLGARCAFAGLKVYPYTARASRQVSHGVREAVVVCACKFVACARVYELPTSTN